MTSRFRKASYAESSALVLAEITERPMTSRDIVDLVAVNTGVICSNVTVNNSWRDYPSIVGRVPAKALGLGPDKVGRCRWLYFRKSGSERIPYFCSIDEVPSPKNKAKADNDRDRSIELSSNVIASLDLLKECIKKLIIHERSS